MSVSSEVRQASDRHYAALERLINGDANPYLAVLTSGSEVGTMLHPLGGQVVGDEAVRRNLQEIVLRRRHHRRPGGLRRCGGQSVS